MNTLFRLLILLFGVSTLVAQNTTAHWEAYMASYEDGKPGSTTVRMDLIDAAPLKELPYVLVTGVTYETSREDGFPDNETFPLLHKIGDELVTLISSEVNAVLVGSFMYEKERLEYFYIKDTTGLKEKIEAFYKQHYPDYTFYLNIEEDKAWEYYTEFLYPNEATQNYMADEKVLAALQEAGDPLTKARRVDHWLYFPAKAEMRKCMAELKKMNFTLETSGKIDDSPLPFQLQVWRVDRVDIDTIYPITSSLRELAKKYKGDYDGWETSVEKD